MTRALSTDAGAWGNRAQIGAALAGLRDLHGNRDGLRANETKATGKSADRFERNPLTARLLQLLDLGTARTDDIERLRSFRQACETRWGRPVSELDLSRLPTGELFAVQKSIALERMGRRPESVTEGFITASGSVDGERIEPRSLFWQRFAPTAKPSGKIVVLSPGFRETGRDFYVQIAALNALGHDVVAMDHQWAGYSEGKPGALDRGFGVARDVAAMSAYAAVLLRRDYADISGAEVVLFGNSMGAGAGVLSALVLNDAGRITLDGRPMPKGLSAVLQAPYLAPTPSLTNRVLQAASHIPILNRLAVPSAGIPVLARDPVGAQGVAQGAVQSDVRAQLASMHTATPDLQRVMAAIDAGQLPQGSLFIVHSDGDPLADPARSRWLAGRMGARASLQIIPSQSHVIDPTPMQQDRAIEGLQALLRAPASAA